MRRIIVAALVITGMMALARWAGAVVLDFEDLPVETVLTDTNYAGLTWEHGSIGIKGNEGYWLVTTLGYPYSGRKYAMNGWGSTLLGVTFPGSVNVTGAYFAGQGIQSYWTTGIRVHGYRAGNEVAVTDWFTDIDNHSDWFGMGLNNVDRIVVESVPVLDGGGTYAMDDFTYEPAPEPSSLAALALGLLPLGAGLARRRKN